MTVPVTVILCGGHDGVLKVAWGGVGRGAAGNNGVGRGQGEESEGIFSFLVGESDLNGWEGRLVVQGHDWSGCEGVKDLS